MTYKIPYYSSSIEGSNIVKNENISLFVPAILISILGVPPYLKYKLGLLGSVVDPDSDWIRIQWGPSIRIGIQDPVSLLWGQSFLRKICSIVYLVPKVFKFIPLYLFNIQSSG